MILAESKAEIALKSWEAGELDQAREILLDAIASATSADENLMLRNRLAMVERSAGNLYEALYVQTQAGFLTQSSTNHDLIGNHFHGLGVTWQDIAERGIKEYFDRAFIAYDCAIPHYEKSGNKKNLSSTLNNIGYLHIQLDQVERGISYLDRAIELAESVGDRERVAQIRTTLAQGRLKQRRNSEAILWAACAYSALKQGSNKLAREKAFEVLRNAVEAEAAGRTSMKATTDYLAEAQG